MRLLCAALLLLTCGREPVRSPQVAGKPVSNDPVFEVGLWPGEGIPVIATVRDTVVLRASPDPDGAVVGRLVLRSGHRIAYDSTRFQTIIPTRLRTENDVSVSGRYLGSLRYLSRDQYYSAAFGDTTVIVTAADTLEYLQYRAEGTCFVRVAFDVIDADPCPLRDTVRVRMLGHPATRWWVYVRMPEGTGWLMVSDTSAKVIDRTF